MKDICILYVLYTTKTFMNHLVCVALHVILLSNTISTPVQVIGHRPYGIQSDLPCMSWQIINYCNRYVLDQLNIFQ